MALICNVLLQGWKALTALVHVLVQRSAVSNSQFSSAQSRRSRLGGGASAVPISIPVLVEAKASGSLCDVGGKPEHVAYSPVPEHMALMQLDRDTLEMKFDDIYPLDSGLAAARLARDVSGACFV